MSDEVNRHDTQQLPVLAKPAAANEVGQALRERVSESLDNTGKALAVVAGVGVFFYAAGYFVEWQRFKKGGLPSEQLLALLPRGQIAAAGVKELFISLVFGGALLALLGWGLVALTRAMKTRAKDSEWARRLYRVLKKNELLVPTVAVGVLTLLIVPFDKAGLIVTAILTALFYYMLRLVHVFLEDEGDGAKFPIWQLSLAVGLAAIVLTGARQWEFPEPRPRARVQLEDQRIILGTYVASDGDKLLIRRKGTPSSRLIVLSGDEIDRVQFWRSSFDFPREPSLLDGALHEVFGTDINLSCIPPECRWGEDTRLGPSSAF